MARKPRIEKQPAATPGARQVALTPGDTASRAGGRAPASGGSRADAVVQPNPGAPDRYAQIAGPTPPTSISDVNMDRNVWSPLQPVVPFGPPSITYPRTYDYPVGVNLDFTSGGRLTFFKMLQAMSRSWGILRAVIETRKDQLMRIPWDIQLVGKPKEKDHPKLKELRAFFKKPDKQNNFNTWMRLQLEDLFVIDAANYYVWRDQGGKPFALMHVAGETIKPLLDDAGRRPEWPNPAFQQLVKGMPWQNLDAHEFVYSPMRPTPQEPMYGMSPVQQIYIEILQGIKKMLYKLDYWTEGSIPQLIITVPSGWTPEQLAAFQAHFDVMMAGNTPYKSRVRFMPSESKPFDIKNANGEVLKTEEDEWVARLVCYAFSVPPTPFIRQMNRATADSAAAEAQEEGLHPLMNWVKEELIDPAIQDHNIGFGYDDCEFVWLPEPEVDEQKQMTVITGYTKVGLMTPDEGRDRINLPPLPHGAGAEAVVETPAGPVPFKETVDAARHKALAAPDQVANEQEKHDVSIAGQQQSQQHADQNQKVQVQQAKKGPPARVKKFAGDLADLTKSVEDEPRDYAGRFTSGGGDEKTREWAREAARQLKPGNADTSSTSGVVSVGHTPGTSTDKTPEFARAFMQRYTSMGAQAKYLEGQSNSSLDRAHQLVHGLDDQVSTHVRSMIEREAKRRGTTLSMATKLVEVGEPADAPFDLNALFAKRGATARTRWRRLAGASMERRAAVFCVKRARSAARDALKKCATEVAAQIRATQKLAKAKRRGAGNEPPDPVDPESVDVTEFDLTAFDDLEGDFADALAAAAEDAAVEMLGQVGLAEDEEIVNQVSERAVAAARDQAAELVSGIDDTTRDMLRDTIAQGLEDNVGLDGIVDQLMDAYAFSEDRAQLIAETEVRNANERGVVDGLRQARDAGNNVKKEWLLGPNPCEVCQENADAGPIDVDDVFPSGDTEPTAHVRCECGLTGVIQDDTGEEDIGEEDVVEALARIAGAYLAKDFNPDQPRDDHGRFGSGGGAKDISTALATRFGTHETDLANTTRVWNDHVKMTPEEFSHAMLGDAQKLATGERVGSFSRWSDKMTYTAKLGEKGIIQRDFDFETRTVNHDMLALDKSSQAAGLAKSILGSEVVAYQKMCLGKVTTLANISVGAYAFAKFGFAPIAGEWRPLAGKLSSHLDDLVKSGKIAGGDVKGLRAALGSQDPKSLWAVVDSNVMVKGGVSFAKSALTGDTKLAWNGQLDLNDKASMARFKKYVS